METTILYRPLYDYSELIDQIVDQEDIYITGEKDISMKLYFIDVLMGYVGMYPQLTARPEIEQLVRKHAQLFNSEHYYKMAFTDFPIVNVLIELLQSTPPVVYELQDYSKLAAFIYCQLKNYAETFDVGWLLSLLEINYLQSQEKLFVSTKLMRRIVADCSLQSNELERIMILVGEVRANFTILVQLEQTQEHMKRLADSGDSQLPGEWYQIFQNTPSIINDVAWTLRYAVKNQIPWNPRHDRTVVDLVLMLMPICSSNHPLHEILLSVNEKIASEAVASVLNKGPCIAEFMQLLMYYIAAELPTRDLEMYGEIMYPQAEFQYVMSAAFNSL